ncbi:Uncharacterised protein [Vibrio cholerae]|nr:Uncharacterised protein [Vibrio cholerae]
MRIAFAFQFTFFRRLLKRLFTTFLLSFFFLLIRFIARF